MDLEISRLDNNLLFMRVGCKEMRKALNSACICDYCATEGESYGYFIPVLNSWYCEDCFLDWSKRAKYYPEDREFEERVYRRTLTALIIKG